MKFIIWGLFLVAPLAQAEPRQPFLCYQQLYRQGGVGLEASQMLCREKPDRSVLDCQNELFLNLGFSISDSIRVCRSRSDEGFVTCVRQETLVKLRPQMLAADMCDKMAKPSQTPFRADFENKKIYPTFNPVDPSKVTICSITVNSANEINAFKKLLAPQGVQFVELTPRIDTSKQFPVIKKDWLSHACRQGIRCDALVISGHFAGQFMGDNIPFELELNDLTSLSCQDNCAGVLKNVKEVYLFGCNTLARNTADSRTPEFYVELLMGHALTRNQAEMQSARRYSGLGLTIEEQIRASFPETKRIFGFPSASPLGENIEGSLTSYIQSLGNYQDHLKRIDEGRPTSDIKKYLGGFGLIHAQGAPTTHRQICDMLRSQDLPMANRTAEALVESGRGLREVLTASWMGAQIRKFKLSQNARDRLRNDTLKLWKQVDTMPSVGFQILDFSAQMEALSPAEVLEMKSEWLSTRIERSGSPMAALRDVCNLSDNHDLSKLALRPRALGILSRVSPEHQKLLRGCLLPYKED